MELADVAALVSIGKDLKSIWDNVAGDDRKKLDSVVRKLGETLIKDPALERQKQFLVSGTDELPIRLAGLVLDKQLRKKIAMRVSDHRVKSDDVAVVKCRQCGALQDLDFG